MVNRCNFVSFFVISMVCHRHRIIMAFRRTRSLFVCLFFFPIGFSFFSFTIRRCVDVFQRSCRRAFRGAFQSPRGGGAEEGGFFFFSQSA